MHKREGAPQSCGGFAFLLIQKDKKGMAKVRPGKLVRVNLNLSNHHPTGTSLSASLPRSGTPQLSRDRILWAPFLSPSGSIYHGRQTSEYI